MVKTESRPITIENLYEKATHEDYKSNHDGINIASDFQRGDEEDGVWNKTFKQIYIDSLLKGYPSGILTFVKDYNGSTNTRNDPWKVLDGGNRLRCIRDYMAGKFVDLNGNKYEELSEKDSAKFNNILIPCQEIRIDREDPANTISEMFIRLNTQTNQLSQGELIKAFGHRRDIWEIEMAKKLIKDNWSSTYQDDEVRELSIQKIHELWSNTMGDLSETKRCDSLAMITGYIISAKTSDFTLFDKRYDKLYPHFSDPNTQPTESDKYEIYKKLSILLCIIEKITDKSIFGNKTKGIYSKYKISPIWKQICEEKIDDDTFNKTIAFYNSLTYQTELREKYLDLFNGSNSETGNAKIQVIVDFILEQ